MLPFLLDLDGVVWRGHTPIAGSAQAVAQLREAGHDVFFVTNNSSSPITDVVAKLAAQGIPAQGAVIGSAAVVAGLVEPGERVMCCGAAGLRQALNERGARVVADHDTGAVDAVVVGYHRTFDYDEMSLAAQAVRRGARLLASNDDATYPTTPNGPDDDGLLPGAGSILAGIEKACGAKAVVAGKPNQPMVEAIRARAGASGVVVGDRLDTDAALAHALGWRFALVLSGVARAGEVESALRSGVLAKRPDWVAADLNALLTQCELLQAVEQPT